MAKARSSLISFFGPPANLSAEVALPCSGNAQPIILVANDQLPLRTTGDAKMITDLAFSMPADTPPGEIEGRVVLGHSTFDAIVDVQLRPMIHVEPSAIELKAAAGETVTATLNVTNQGNGTLNYDADKAATLRQAGTLARSVISAFKQPDRDFADRVISLGEEMATAPSHELAVVGHMASTTLKMGAHTTVKLELGIPKELEPETTWTGSLALLGARIRISVEAVHSR